MVPCGMAESECWYCVAPSLLVSGVVALRSLVRSNILLGYWLGMDSGCLVAVSPLFPLCFPSVSPLSESVYTLSMLFKNVENCCKLLIDDG